MAVLLVEGFESIGLPSRLSEKGWTLGNNYDTYYGQYFDSDYGFTPGRVTGYSFRLTSGGYAGQRYSYAYKTIPGNPTKCYAGFGWMRDTVAYGATSYDPLHVIAILYDSPNNLGVQIRINGSRQIEVFNYSSGTIVATGTTAIPHDEWHYIEFMAYFNGASGSVEVHLDGATEISATTVDLGAGSFTHFFLYCYMSDAGNGINNGAFSQFDDVYVLDDSGSAPRNTFLGDCVVETVFPAADGANSNWTPNSGSAHYSRVNESSGTYPDGDTSYVSSSTVGDYDTYDHGSLRHLTDDTVFAVQTNLSARKDDGSTRKIKHVARTGGSNSDGTEQTMTSSYATYAQIREQDPSAADWTESSVNAAEFGVKETA